MQGTKWNSPDILKVLIEEPIAPKTCESMFSQCINLESIENMNYLHTENATNMEKTCHELGMTMTTAFTIFAKKMSREKKYHLKCLLIRFILKAI